MATDEFDPSKDSTLVNGLRLWRHIVEKGFQFGSVIGLAIVVPIVAYKQKKQGVTLQAAAPKLARAQVIAAASGLALSSKSGCALLCRLSYVAFRKGICARCSLPHSGRVV